MAKKRRKAKRQGSGRVLPEPPPGLDPGAHFHQTVCKLYNMGLVQFGTVDRFMIVTSMTCLDDVMQNREGSMTHSVVDWGSVLGTEPGFPVRVGLVQPPGHGYVRYLLYDLSQPITPAVAVWFNPLVGEAKRFVGGAGGALGERLAALDRVRENAGLSEDQFVEVLQNISASGGPKFEEGNDLYKAKSVIDGPDGGVTGVVVTQEVFNRAVDLLEGVMVGDGHRATREDLQQFKAAQTVPITRGEKTEPLFKMFGVTTQAMSLTVEGFSKRLLGDY